MSSSEELDTERPHTVQTKMYLIRAKCGGPEGLVSGLLALFPPLSSQSPRAEALMKTNARNQFSASSFHLVGARLCTSISTPAGGELLQSSARHTSISRSSWRLQPLCGAASIKTNGTMPPKAKPQNGAVLLKPRMMWQLCQPQQH